MAINGARADQRRVTPHLLVQDAARAVELYQRALGADELYRSALPGGAGIHVHVRIGDSLIMMTNFSGPGHPGVGSPASLSGASTILAMYLDDVDAAHQRALDAGAKPPLRVADTFWGDRYGWVTDPFGQVWALATVKEELTPEQVNDRMGEHVAQMQNKQSK